MSLEQTTVLIVDDSDAMRASIRRTLEQSDLSLHILEAGDGAEAMPVALSGDVHIVLTDVVMPNLNGLQLLRGIRQKCDQETLPVILITSEDDADKRALSFESGANDYLCKPFSPIELLSRIRVQMRLRQLQAELRAANERVRERAMRDELTGFCNRRSFHDELQRELSRCHRHGFGLAILLIDIDDFRVANQRMGELVGDAIISELGALIEGQLRSTDLLARVGGQKFAVLVPRADNSLVQTAAERVQATVSQHAFPGLKAGAVKVSVGIATYPNGAQETVEEILNSTEAALAKAKTAGGGRVEWWREEAP